MIVGSFKAGTEFRGQKMLHLTELFGKNYYWMQDGDGVVYLCAIDEEGNPKFV